MSENWRRATAPSSPSRARDIEVNPPGYSSGAYDDPAKLRSEVSRLQASLTAVLRDRDQLQRELSGSRSDSTAISEIGRRDLLESAARERRRADAAESAVNSLSQDNEMLKRKLQETSHMSRDAYDSLSHTKSIYERELLDLKVAHQDTVTQLRAENQVLAEENRRLVRETATLERLCDEVKKELMLSERTVLEQASTIRTMSADMSRRDAVNTVRHHREVLAEKGELEELLIENDRLKKQLRSALAESDDSEHLKKQLRSAQEEKDVALKAKAELEESVKKLTALQQTNQSAADARIEAEKAKIAAQLNAQQAKITALEAEVAQLKRDYNEALSAQEKHKALAIAGDKARSDAVQQIQQAQAEAQKHKASIQQQQDKYEKTILQLQTELKALKGETLKKDEDLLKQQAEFRNRELQSKRNTDAAKERELAELKAQLAEARKKMTEKELVIEKKEEEMAKQATAKEVAGTQVTQSSTSAGPKGEDMTVTFTIAGCNKLVNRGGLIVDDPDSYVLVYGPGQKPGSKPLLRTPTKDNDYNPTWRPDEATVKIPINTASPGFITFEVWDHDPMSGDDILGVFKLAVGDLLPIGSGPRVFDLQPRVGEDDAALVTNAKSLGSISLIIDIPGVAPSKQPTTGPGARGALNTLTEEVAFYISGCEGLLKRDTIGDTDAFVIVRDPEGVEVLRTCTKDGTCNPTWPVDEASVKLNLVKSSAGFVTFEVYDWDATSNDFLGTCRLSVADIFTGGSRQRKLALEPRAKETEDIILKNVGKLGTLTLNTTIMADQAAINLLRGKEPPKPIKTKNVPYDVTLYVPRCDDLWDREGKKGIDPFIKIIDHKGKLLKTTETIDDTCDPTWPIDKASVKITVMPDDPGFITFEVWNWNAISNDFLGCHRFLITEIFAKGNGEFVFPLGTRLKETDKEVTKQAATPQSLGTITIVSNVIEQPPVAAAPPGTAEAAAANAAKYDVKFYVAGCYGLLDREGKGGKDTSDPFIKVVNGKGEKIFETDEKQDCLDPVWAVDEASFQMKLSPAGSDHIEFQVWDKNTLFRNTFLGAVRLTEAEVFAVESGPRLLDLKPREKETEVEIKEAPSLGKLKLIVTIPEGLAPKSTGSDMTSRANDVQPVEATVTVVSADGLWNRDGFGSGLSDPFVKVCDERGVVVHTTEVIDNSLTPKWAEGKEVCRLLVTPGGLALGKKKIRFEVYDWNKIGSPAFLGCVELDPDELIKFGTSEQKLTLTPRSKEPEKDVEDQYKSKGLGTLTIKFKIPQQNVSASTESIKVMKLGDGPSAAAEATTQQRSADVQAGGVAKVNTATAVPPQQVAPLEVTFNIVKATGVMNRDGFGSGDSDPYVKVCDETGKVVHTTEVVSDSLNPVWPQGKETVRVTVSPGGKNVKFEVWDYNKIQSHSFLGCAELSANDIVAKGSGFTHELPLVPREKETDNNVLDQAKKPGGLGVLFVSTKFALPTPPAASAPPATATAPAAASVVQGTAPQGTSSASSGAQPASQQPAAVVAASPAPTTANVAAEQPLVVKPAQSAAAPAEKPAGQPSPAQAPATTPVVNTQTATPSSTAPQQTSSGAVASASPEKPKEPKPLKVILKVLGATDLVDKDKGSWGSGVSDPYCTVTFNGKTVITTPSVDNDLNPVWTTKNAAEALTIQPGDRGNFIFVVMDKNVSSDSFLGMADLSLDTIRSFGEGIFEKTLDLGPRPGEKDEDILKAKSLGKVKYSVSVTSALSR